jgi:hypothetical protein
MLAAGIYLIALNIVATGVFLLVKQKWGLLSYDLAPPPPPPPLPDSMLDRRHTGRLRKRDNFLTGEVG